jgi:hypothetical protein
MNPLWQLSCGVMVLTSTVILVFGASLVTNDFACGESLKIEAPHIRVHILQQSLKLFIVFYRYLRITVPGPLESTRELESSTPLHCSSRATCSRTSVFVIPSLGL